MHRTKSKSLGKLFRFSKSLPEAQAQLRERHIAPSAFSPQLGAAEFLWRRKHAGRRSDSSRKQPKRRTGCRLCDFPRETEARRIFLPANLALHYSRSCLLFWPCLPSAASTRGRPQTSYPPCPPVSSRTMLPTNALASPNSIRVLSR